MVALFNSKTLARYIQSPTPIPADHLEVLEQWAELIKSGRILDLKETAVHGDFKTKIVEGVLGYTGPVGEESFTVATEKATPTVPSSRPGNMRRAHPV